MRRKQDHAASAEDWTTIDVDRILISGMFDALIRSIEPLYKALEVMQAEIEELETRVTILELANRPPDS